MDTFPWKRSLLTGGNRTKDEVEKCKRCISTQNFTKGPWLNDNLMCPFNINKLQLF